MSSEAIRGHQMKAHDHLDLQLRVVMASKLPFTAANAASIAATVAPAAAAAPLPSLSRHASPSPGLKPLQLGGWQCAFDVQPHPRPRSRWVE